MASARKAIILELLLIPVFRRMPLNFSSYSFELVYPFTPRSAQNEKSNFQDRSEISDIALC